MLSNQNRNQVSAAGVALVICWGALSALTFTGCGNGDESLETGEVTLSWLVGPRGCEDTGATRVVVNALDKSGEPSRSLEWGFSCQARSGRLRDLEPGTYTFVLQAITPTDEVVYVGETGLVQVRPGGVTAVDPVAMQATPARLSVQWRFRDGRLCAQSGVTQVTVLAFDMFGTIEAQATALCDAGGVVTDIRPGTYDVVLHGINDDQLVTYDAIFEIELQRGERATQQVVLDRLDGTSAMTTPIDG